MTDTAGKRIVATSELATVLTPMTKRANISVNASTRFVAESVVRKHMQANGIAGKVIGSALASEKRADDKVAIYTKEDTRDTFIVYVER